MKNSLLLRTITGVLFVCVIVGCILFHPISFVALFTLVSAATIYEFCTLINKIEKVHINAIVCMAGGIYLFLAFTGYCSNMSGSGIFLPYLIILMYLLISELYLNRPKPISNWAFAMFSQLYIALPFALLNVLYYQRRDDDLITLNPILPLSIFIFLWLNDTGAYCIGTLFGKHRLFERISPKKSWEGSLGGGILTILVSILFAFYFPFMNLPEWIGLAIIIVVFGTWGDLTESLIKRKLGIKDSGNILPGHGGLLDRFDSSLMAIPASACYLYFLCC